MNFNVDNLITAVSTVGAAAVSGLLAFLATRHADKLTSQAVELARLRSSLRSALRQVESFHVEEGLMAAELESLGLGSAKQMKTRFRDEVANAGFQRPLMTAHEARKSIDEIELVDSK